MSGDNDESTFREVERLGLLNAWQEVDNALTAYAAEQHRRDELERAVAQNRQALTLARELYTRGLADSSVSSRTRSEPPHRKWAALGIPRHS